MPFHPVQPPGQVGPEGKGSAGLDPGDLLRFLADQPLRGRVEVDDPAPEIEHDDQVVHLRDNQCPGDGRQVQQMEPEQRGQEGQTGHRETHRHQIDGNEPANPQHVDDLDHPRQEHAEEHHRGLKTVQAREPDGRQEQQ